MPQSGGADPLIHFDRYDVGTKGLEPGVHTLYVRVKDENGVWSAVQSAAVEIRQPEGGRMTLSGHPAGFREPAMQYLWISGICRDGRPSWGIYPSPPPGKKG